MLQGFANPPAWKKSAVEWYVGATKVDLNPSTSQQYYFLFGPLMIVQGVLKSQSGTPAGIFELRNLPVKPKLAGSQVCGSGEWTDEGTNFHDIRWYCSDLTNGYFRARLYNTFADLSATVTGSQSDGIQFTLIYPCAG